MSTLAQHVAMLEMYRHLKKTSAFTSEAHLLAEAHLGDIAAMLDPVELELARDGVEGLASAAYGDKSLIDGWRKQP